MLSRVADTIYWMNRYLERVENYARFMDVNYNLSLEIHPNASERWKPVIVTSGDWEFYQSLYGDVVDKKKVIHFMGFDLSNLNSMISCISNARENARAVRTEITKEVWENINGLYYKIKKGADKKVWERKDPRKFFIEVKEGCQLIKGIYDSTISRTEGWHFAKMGQSIERADKTSRVLDVKYQLLLSNEKSAGSPVDLVQWSALLKSVSAYDMYRKKYGKLHPETICEFLIFDTTFPRSIVKCINRAQQSLEAISGKDELHHNEANKKLVELKSYLAHGNISEVLSTGLHDYLDDIQWQLNETSNAIFETYFSASNILSNYIPST